MFSGLSRGTDLNALRTGGRVVNSPGTLVSEDHTPLSLRRLAFAVYPGYSAANVGNLQVALGGLSISPVKVARNLPLMIDTLVGIVAVALWVGLALAVASLAPQFKRS